RQGKLSREEEEIVMLPIRTILHPTDFSERSETAFRLACGLARDHGAQVVVLHVAQIPATIYAETIAFPRPEDFKDELREKLHSIQAADAGLAVCHRLEEGTPADEILRVAQMVNADLIVMGTHGRRGLRRLLMGSVAEKVVRQS